MTKMTNYLADKRDGILTISDFIQKVKGVLAQSKVDEPKGILCH